MPLRKLLLALYFGGLITACALVLAGPRGIPRVLALRQELKAAQQRVEALERARDEKIKRLRELQENPDKLRLEIRKELKMQEPGTWDYYYPPEELNNSNTSP